MTRRCSIVLGMAANFREVAACSGVDENLPTGAQGIVVPSGGSTLVILEDARGLDVRSTCPQRCMSTSSRQNRNALCQHGTPRTPPRRCDYSRWFLAYLQDQG
jgi:hypothetical protein